MNILFKKTHSIGYYFFLITLLSLVTISVWILVLSRAYTGKLTVAFLDVGQGDAIYIETPHGNQLLLDGGNGRAVLGQLDSVMSYFDRSIDVVLISHPDTDHIGGLPEVFKRFSVGMFLEPGVEESGSEYKALTDAVKTEGIVANTIQNGMYIELDQDVVLTILFPDRDVTSVETNTGSVVARLTYKDTSFLFTGDSPSGIETYLASKYEGALKSDVLKLGHHGSKTSSSEVFLGYVDPTYAVISVGCDNSYGHPHKEVLERLVRFDIQEFSTCKEGMVVFESDGHKIRPK